MMIFCCILYHIFIFQSCTVQTNFNKSFGTLQLLLIFQHKICWLLFAKQWEKSPFVTLRCNRMYSGRTANEDNVIISSHRWNGTQEAVIDCNEGVIKRFNCNVSFSMMIDRKRLDKGLKESTWIVSIIYFDHSIRILCHVVFVWLKNVICNNVFQDL